jgi:hypothetical protein
MVQVDQNGGGRGLFLQKTGAGNAAVEVQNVAGTHGVLVFNQSGQGVEVNNVAVGATFAGLFQSFVASPQSVGGFISGGAHANRALTVQTQNAANPFAALYTESNATTATGYALDAVTTATSTAPTGRVRALNPASGATCMEVNHAGAGVALAVIGSVNSAGAGILTVTNPGAGPVPAVLATALAGNTGPLYSGVHGGTGDLFNCAGVLPAVITNNADVILGAAAPPAVPTNGVTMGLGAAAVPATPAQGTLFVDAAGNLVYSGPVTPNQVIAIA